MENDIIDLSTNNESFGLMFLSNDDIIETEDIKKKIDTVMVEINAFLDKLAENPEKEIIKWPDRAKKVQEFKAKLNKIVE